MYKSLSHPNHYIDTISSGNQLIFQCIIRCILLTIFLFYIYNDTLSDLYAMVFNLVYNDSELWKMKLY